MWRESTCSLQKSARSRGSTCAVECVATLYVPARKSAPPPSRVPVRGEGRSALPGSLRAGIVVQTSRTAYPS
ncbi:hypothetical protein SCWH03_53780 [Streptomyces pacificus]|uniref:Uncharacterized protein n=1 Tax=Streptomyces pacificus TaxID=2705029 RepID=A0A6A0B348_9ACTN|nr:hypothetical protein SCWH03_53780 [Streptomyces pacificus]